MTQYKGFELFDDITNDVLRVRNQAVVMANIAEDNSKNGFISPKGTSLMLGYFQQIPDKDKTAVNERCKEFMRERNFVS